MVPRNIIRIRNTAATLLTLSGISHIAMLWFRDIDGTALAAAGFGALYLIIGIGLYGQSRFALFMAIIIPTGGVWLALSYTGLVALSPLGLSQMAIALVVVFASAVVLFTVRHNASI